MNLLNEWSRRRFLAISSATAAQAAASLKGLAQASAQQTPASITTRIPLPPEVISGGIQPLMASMTARPLRYRPIAGEFVIHNGEARAWPAGPCRGTLR